MKRIINKIINKENFSKFGTITGVIMVLCLLIALVINAISEVNSVNSESLGGALISLISSAINIVFYLLVTNYFRKSKDNFFFGFYAVTLILVADYIIPMIFEFIEGALNLMIIFPSIMMILALIYFIFLCIENRKREKRYLTYLKIVGIILGVFAFGYGIYNIVTTCQTLFYNLDIFLSDLPFLFYYIIYIIYYIASSICLPIIFSFYPFVLDKERYY